MIAANQVPDHTTLARFRQRHQDALAGLFGDVLGICAQAGLVQVDVIAVDGTKVHANASERATCDYQQIAREILADADAVDQEEDERYGERRGDELPEHLATVAGGGCPLPSVTLHFSLGATGLQPPSGARGHAGYRLSNWVTYADTKPQLARGAAQ